MTNFNGAKGSQGQPQIPVFRRLFLVNLCLVLIDTLFFRLRNSMKLGITHTTRALHTHMVTARMC